MDAKFKSLQSKLRVWFCFIIIPILSWGQSSDLLKKNELKLNAFTTIVGYLEMSYDYMLNDESSIGISGGFSIDKDLECDLLIFPNYRLFFGKKPAAGFFIEANAAIFSQEQQEAAFFGTTSAENGKSYMGFGLGIAVGGKFISTKSGFVGELFVGGGRNFLNTDLIDSGYPRVGISVGKRF